MLFGDMRLRMQAGPHDQFDLPLYSGSRDNLSNWGTPRDSKCSPLSVWLHRSSRRMTFRI